MEYEDEDLKLSKDEIEYIIWFLQSPGTCNNSNEQSLNIWQNIIFHMNKSYEMVEEEDYKYMILGLDIPIPDCRKLL